MFSIFNKSNLQKISVVFEIITMFKKVSSKHWERYIKHWETYFTFVITPFASTV